MLWNIVYEFYVKYIFGGLWLGEEGYDTFFGYTYSSTDEYFLADGSSLNYTFIKFSGYNQIEGVYFDYMNLGNYLSLIATIITMVAILLLCVFFIKKIIAIVFRLFTGGSSF